MALAQFLFTCIDKSSRDSIKHALTNEQDGIELILFYADTQRSFQHFRHLQSQGSPVQSTSWERTDTIDMFNSRFRKRAANYHTTLSTANNTMTAQKMSTNDLVQLYLPRLVTTMPKTNSLYTRIRDEFVQVQAHIDNNTPMHTSITLLTQQLQSLESLELHNTNQPTQSEFRRPRMIPNQFKRPTNAVRPHKRKDQDLHDYAM
jgi:hypothetical protein